jgi:ABC-type branched-subunit amino acid transport system substrate-binding protein
MNVTLALLVLSGCGLVRADRCATDEDCLAAFGWGHQCGEQGACLALEPTERCGTAWPEDTWSARASYRDALVFGSLIDAAPFPLERDAVRLAVDQINDLGGIDGYPVLVLECDASEVGEDRTAALSEVAAFLGEQGAAVPAVVGPITSSDARLLSSSMRGVLVSPGASAISLSATELAPVWRVVPSDADLAQAFVRSMIDDGIGKSVTLHSREQGQTELAQALQATLQVASSEYPELGGELMAFASSTERDARVVEAAYADVDAVVILSEDPSDYIEVLLAASAIEEYEDLVVYVGPGAYRQEVLQQAAAAAALFPNVRGVRSATRQGAVADVFRASFSSAHGGTDPDTSAYAGQAYDSAWSVFSAMLWSGMRYGKIDPPGISEGLGSLSFGLPLALGPAGWAEVTTSFAQAEPVDLDGASSPLDFDPASRAIRGPVAVWAIEGDTFVTLREYAF